jgi:hypothetical protein
MTGPVNANQVASTAPPPKPVQNSSSSGAVNPAAQPAASTGGKTTNPSQAELAQGSVASTANSISNGSSKMAVEANNKSSTDDYNARKSAIAENSNSQKVALVGRTGAGARALTSGFSRGNTVQSVGDSMSVVVFEATPELSEAGTTILVNIGEIRAAASVVIYMGSPSRTFTLNAKFVSRTVEEATKNFQYVNWLKAWRMPTLKSGESYGAEPETLRLFAYGNVLKGIPVMITSINVNYSSEVDYIQTSDGAWVPIIQEVGIGLLEVRSIEDLASFDYDSFKSGKLDQW